MPKRSKQRSSLWNWGLLLLFGIAIPVSMIEVLLRVFAGALPISLEKYLPTDVRILAQSSKEQEMPREYIALLGDSYAAGWGDWYLTALDQMPLERPPYHSAHVIFSRTGRDVLSLAQPGFGSFDGLVYYPLRYVKRLQSRDSDFGFPAQIVIYFYEGNDFKDNITFLERYWPERPENFSKDELRKIFDEVISLGPLDRRSFVGKIRNSDVASASYTVKFFYTLAQDLERLIKRSLDVGSDDGSQFRIPEDERSTKLRVDGEEVVVPVAIQAPAVQFNDREIGEALEVLELSLEYLKRVFEGSALAVVYLPAPLSSYEIASDQAQVYIARGTAETFATDDMHSRSDTLCRKVSRVAENVGAAFLDTRPFMLSRSRHDVIHGPRDWAHFNRLGYEALGEVVSGFLEHNPSGTSEGAVETAHSHAPLTSGRCGLIVKATPTRSGPERIDISD